jgi:hypothetical protein
VVLEKTAAFANGVLQQHALEREASGSMRPVAAA